MENDDEGKYQKGGCGGFGKGNISELFKSIEEYEKTLEAKKVSESSSTWEYITCYQLHPPTYKQEKPQSAACHDQKVTET